MIKASPPPHFSFVLDPYDLDHHHELLDLLQYVSPQAAKKPPGVCSPSPFSRLLFSPFPSFSLISEHGYHFTAKNQPKKITLGSSFLLLLNLFSP